MREARHVISSKGDRGGNSHVGTLTRSSKLFGKNSRTSIAAIGWKFLRYAEENILRWGKSNSYRTTT